MKKRDEIRQKSSQLCGKVKVTLNDDNEKDSYGYIVKGNKKSLIVDIKVVGNMKTLTFTKPVWDIVGKNFIYQYEKVFLQSDKFYTMKEVFSCCVLYSSKRKNNIQILSFKVVKTFHDDTIISFMSTWLHSKKGVFILFLKLFTNI